jgi:GAF domain-containing protein
VLDDVQRADPELVGRLDEMTTALADLADVLGREEELGRVLQRSIDQITSAVPNADMASVSVLRGDGEGDEAETVAASNERVWAIDSDQHAAGEGPWLEAARTGQVVRTGVEQARQRWPDFTRSARAAGVESYLSVPLLIDEKFAGSLNLYSEQRHGFGDFDVALLRLYVTAACAAIANARRSVEARRLAVQLSQALDSRAVIDQARGMLMERDGINAEDAFGELVRESQSTNTKLREVAARLTDNLRRHRA